MNLRTSIFLLGMLTIETVLLTVYSSQPQRVFTSKSPLRSYRPLRFPWCSHAQQKVLLSSFSASDSALVACVLTAKRRDCPEFAKSVWIGHHTRYPGPGPGAGRRLALRWHWHSVSFTCHLLGSIKT
jgi:hypothetical protein